MSGNWDAANERLSKESAFENSTAFLFIATSIILLIYFFFFMKSFSFENAIPIVKNAVSGG